MKDLYTENYDFLSWSCQVYTFSPTCFSQWAPSLHSPSTVHQLAYVFSFSFFHFSFPVDSVLTLTLCLTPASGCHLCTLALLHSRAPATPRGELLHDSGGPVFCLVPGFCSCHQGDISILPGSDFPMGLTFRGPTNL